MRAVRIESPGGPDVLRLETVSDPEPGEGRILVDVATSGLNRADLLQRRGGYPAPPGAPQDIPGLEFAGTVAAVGPGVSRWAVGDRVMGIVAGGGYAEKVVVHESVAVSAPTGVDLQDAGAIPEVFMTAFDAVFLQAELQPGETLLIHAVGSGVGTAAVQLARRLGAITIGTSRTVAKLDRAAGLGLDVGIPGGDGWWDEVLEHTEGRGADVILDLVGGPYLSGNQRALARRGCHVVVGVPGGAKAEIDLRALMVKRGRIHGTVLRARSREEKAELARRFTEDVLPGFNEGSLQPVIDRILPASNVAEAHAVMERNENFGKILLSWE
ncbi:MAG: NAD(P)H-quinone oxidoreductase [Gemmatimonadetes bacterium]|nr:NAD(P)H-quinone oxidoreductase [Gemmatimonadota bacterium]NNM32120.1 NAD(P)H-quinone oxidoreductase [Gemmatimonadota bacterium]